MTKKAKVPLGTEETSNPIDLRKPNAFLSSLTGLDFFLVIETQSGSRRTGLSSGKGR